MMNFKTAVILAGGKSQRMGFDKQFLMINNMRIIEKQVIKLKEEFEEILVITNKPEYYAKVTGIKVVSDEIREMGPLGGIHTGLKAASSDFVYFIACDMPCVNTDYIKFMKSRICKLDVDACVTRSGEWIEPLNAFYSRGIIESIETDLLNGKGSLYYLLSKLKCLYIEEKEARKFSPNWGMFLNLNTRDELEKFEQLPEGWT